MNYYKKKQIDNIMKMIWTSLNFFKLANRLFYGNKPFKKQYKDPFDDRKNRK